MTVLTLPVKYDWWGWEWKTWANNYLNYVDLSYNHFSARLLQFNIKDAFTDDDWDVSQAERWLALIPARHPQNANWDSNLVSTAWITDSSAFSIFSETRKFTTPIKEIINSRIIFWLYSSNWAYAQISNNSWNLSLTNITSITLSNKYNWYFYRVNWNYVVKAWDELSYSGTTDCWVKIYSIWDDWTITYLRTLTWRLSQTNFNHNCIVCWAVWDKVIVDCPYFASWSWGSHIYILTLNSDCTEISSSTYDRYWGNNAFSPRGAWMFKYGSVYYFYFIQGTNVIYYHTSSNLSTFTNHVSSAVSNIPDPWTYPHRVWMTNWNLTYFQYPSQYNNNFTINWTDLNCWCFQGKMNWIVDNWKPFIWEWKDNAKYLQNSVKWNLWINWTNLWWELYWFVYDMSNYSDDTEWLTNAYVNIYTWQSELYCNWQLLTQTNGFWWTFSYEWPISLWTHTTNLKFELKLLWSWITKTAAFWSVWKSSIDIQNNVSWDATSWWNWNDSLINFSYIDLEL